MQITAESRLRPCIWEGMNLYAANDKRNTAIARPATIKRLGPSGSLKKKNSILEQMTAVAPNIIKEIFFDLKYIFANLLLSIRHHWFSFFCDNANY
jgi:hypothetical protein